jgi:hypothetical protein
MFSKFPKFWLQYQHVAAKCPFLIFVLFHIICFFSLSLLTFLFLSPKRLNETHPDSTEDSIPDSKSVFSCFFQFYSQVSFFCEFCFCMFLFFSESSVKPLFSSCFYLVSLFGFFWLFFIFSFFLIMCFVFHFFLDFWSSMRKSFSQD